MTPDLKQSASGTNQLCSRSSSPVSWHSTISSTAAIGSHRASPTVVASDDERPGELSELEGTEAYLDESSAAEDVTAGSRWTSDPGSLVAPQGRRFKLVPHGPRPVSTACISLSLIIDH
jgi:hypothetical protein